MRLFFYSLLIAGCLVPLLCVKPTVTTATGTDKAAGGIALNMPKQCRPGKTSPQSLSWRWRPGTFVKVYYLKRNFTGAEADALSLAVNNWNDALKEIDTRVQFLVGGESETVFKEGTSITVMRGVPSVKARVGEIKLHSVSNGRVHLVLVIRPEVTDLNALTSLMTHELGHTMGLADCYECHRGTTAMAAFRGNNKGNDVYKPSECDRYVVAAGYKGKVSEQARLASIEQN